MRFMTIFKATPAADAAAVMPTDAEMAAHMQTGNAVERFKAIDVLTVPQPV